MRLTLVINSLGAGGAEKILTILANHWSIQSHSVTILTFDDGKSAPFYELGSSINYCALSLGTKKLGLLNKIFALPRLLFALNKKIKNSKPDIVISFMDQANMLTLAALVGSKVPVIVSERVNPQRSSIAEHIAPLRWILCIAREVLYRSSQALVVQTDGAKNYFTSRGQNSVTVIPNPVSAPKNEALDLKISKDTIVTIGRLVPQKRIDLIIRSFARIAAQNPDWTLMIIGDGPLRKDLEGLALSLGIKERCVFTGLMQSPSKILQQASIFVLASDYEGFPGALCEAMASGLAVISTRCDFGPEDIIEDFKNGLLVPVGDSVALGEAIHRLIGDPLLREKLGDAARNITVQFSLEQVIQLWDSVFTQIKKVA